MKIAVGSKNPVKVQAVTNIVTKIWENAEVVSIDVPSGVSDMPTSQKESITGAKNRAKLALEQTNSDIGMGIEGGCEDTENGMFLEGWVATIDKNGKTGLGAAGGFFLPESIAKELRAGKELGPVMDELLNDKNTKQKQGAVGYFTKGLVPRVQAFEKPVIFALIPFFHDMY